MSFIGQMMKTAYSRPAPALMVGAVLVAGVLGGLPAMPTAAAAVSDKDISNTQDTAPDSRLVLRIQRALAKQGFYKGLINGKMNRETTIAIHSYQAQAGLPRNARITEDLARALETDNQVSGLMNRLQRVRDQQIASAEAALLSRPETRALVKNLADETADPTRDARPCFQAPTVSCLLVEAVESAKAIHKPEMRDWALGEVLVVQARVGMAKEAMTTVRRIRDPRLIMVALGNIAEAEARAGRFDAAISAADIIPDIKQKADSLAIIAELEAKQTGKTGKAMASLNAAISKIAEAQQRVVLLARAAKTLWRADDKSGANKKIATAEALALKGKTAVHRNIALGHIAAAYAETGQPDRAIRVLKKIGDAKSHGPVLVSAATAHAQAGATDAALSLADDIDTVRYRAVVLSRIATAEALAKNEEAANATLERAIREANAIRFPYARDYAWSRIALAMRDLAVSIKNGKQAATFERAIQSAEQIKDNQLRAQVLWTIAGDRRRIGDTAGAELSDAIAMRATESIKSVLSRVWVYSDSAANHAERNEKEEARRAFRAGLAIAENLKNAWGRTRALGKLAATLVYLDEETGTLSASTQSPAPTSPN